MEPERSGLIHQNRPKIINPDGFRRCLERLANQGGDVFIDKNRIGLCPVHTHPTIKYGSPVSYCCQLLCHDGDPRWKPVLEEMAEAYQKVAMFYAQDLFKRPNVFITEGVLNEIDKAQKIVKREARQYIKKRHTKFTKPFKITYQAAKENQEKTRKYEENPLAEIVFNMLPLETDSRELSIVDRKLIATSLVKGLTTDQNGTILTEDRGITKALIAFKQDIGCGEVIKQLGDFEPPGGFKKVDIRIASMRIYKGKDRWAWEFANIIRYENLFNN